MQPDVFEEYEQINQQLMDVIRKIRLLCSEGKYDDAQTTINLEYKPLETRWRDCQKRFLSIAIK